MKIELLLLLAAGAAAYFLLKPEEEEAEIMTARGDVFKMGSTVFSGTEAILGPKSISPAVTPYFSAAELTEFAEGRPAGPNTRMTSSVSSGAF